MRLIKLISNLKIKATLSILIILNALTAFGQKIEIGQDAEEIKSTINWLTANHNKVNSFGSTSISDWTWDVSYEDDIITDVIQCYNNQYLNGIGIISYYCKDYIMQNGLLAYTLTQFADLSVEKLNEYYESKFGEYKIGDWYFSEDYEYYSIIYASDSGETTIKWGKTDMNEMPPDIQAGIEKKKMEQERSNLENPEEMDSIVKKEKEIKSKTYDLEIHDTAAYNIFIKDLRQSIVKELEYDYALLDRDQIENSDSNYFIFKNSYSALFKIINYEMEIPDDGDMLNENYYDIRSDNHFVHLSGDDSTCSLLKNSPNLPVINYQGYGVMTDASVRNINVFYVKGITQVKIKKGNVEYIKYSPPAEVQEQVSQKIKTLRNGRYKIKYETGMVMGEPFADTEDDKMNSLAGKILTITGGILILTLYILTLPGE